MSISFSNATELNEQVFYNGEIKNAYNQNETRTCDHGSSSHH